MALNAKDSTAAFRAFRAEADTGSPEKRMSNEYLARVLEGLKKKHSVIAGKFASDAGIDLMNQDARMVERLFEHFTAKEVPILSVHDSFIVPLGWEAELEAQMQTAFAAVTGIDRAKVKGPESLLRFLPVRRRKLRSSSGLDYRHLNARFDETYPRLTDRYVRERDSFVQWLRSNG